MKETLPPPIAAYIDASNGRNVEALIGCFTPDAVVVDEGQTYHGIVGIRTWFARTVEAYEFTLQVHHAAAQESETIVTCEVSGTFAGSPVQLPFRFTLKEDQIAALTIGE
jgi:ketosteroid isomerase-like protein